jgi:hypothetical protein
LSSLVKDILSAFANDPFRLFSQHERRLCRYAPRPASFPVKSTCTPSGRRTKRTIVRFARMVRHPTQVRCGMCFGCFGGLPDNYDIQCFAPGDILVSRGRTILLPSLHHHVYAFSWLSLYRDPRHKQSRPLSSSFSCPFSYLTRLHRLQSQLSLVVSYLAGV